MLIACTDCASYYNICVYVQAVYMLCSDHSIIVNTLHTFQGLEDRASKDKFQELLPLVMQVRQLVGGCVSG